MMYLDMWRSGTFLERQQVSECTTDCKHGLYRILGDVSWIQKATLHLYRKNVPLLDTSRYMCIIACDSGLPCDSTANDKRWGGYETGFVQGVAVRSWVRKIVSSFVVFVLTMNRSHDILCAEPQMLMYTVYAIWVQLCSTIGLPIRQKSNCCVLNVIFRLALEGLARFCHARGICWADISHQWRVNALSLDFTPQRISSSSISEL